MADSKREQIIQALIGRLATISTANGYETGLGAKVARGLREVPKKDELPAIVLREGKATTNATVNAGFDTTTLRIELAARDRFQEGVENAYGRANKMLADLTKALGVDPTFGGLAIDTMLIENNIGVEDKGFSIAAIDASVDIKFRTFHLNPYN